MNLQRIFLYGISFLFSLLILSGNAPISFSESEVRTVILFVEPPKNNVLPLNDNSQNNDDNKNHRQPPSIPQELPTSFVTGNEYALNSNPI